MHKAALISLAALIFLAKAPEVQADTVVYYHNDSLGTPIAITDASGMIVGTTEYSPYGESLNGEPDDEPGYTGHVQDHLTGLIYMEQRYYDPELGLFISADPVSAIESGDWRFFTRYAYAFGNPYSFVDPDGRAALSGCTTSGCDSTATDPGPAPTNLPRLEVKGERPPPDKEPEIVDIQTVRVVGYRSSCITMDTCVRPDQVKRGDLTMVAVVSIGPVVGGGCAVIGGAGCIEGARRVWQYRRELALACTIGGATAHCHLDQHMNNRQAQLPDEFLVHVRALQEAGQRARPGVSIEAKPVPPP
ncbi:RHS repeat-associated core domain-containing protein [Pseudoxanthomonas suwonensis]|uniref:RHS repeat domain-containing protein n=1 Tax=Pseudoxanthomonas suwonensis TaxID=314722 RepID=UPI000A705022